MLDDSSAGFVPGLKIGEVVERTGVSANTIRSWELRGQLGRPSRTETNRRLYSEDDIAAIIRLRDRDKRRGLRVVEPGEGRTDPPPRPVDPPASRTLPLSRASVTVDTPSDSVYRRFDLAEADLAFDSWLAGEDLAGVLDRAIALIGPRGGLPRGPIRRFATEHLRGRLGRFLPLFRPDIDRRPVVVGSIAGDDLPAMAAGLLLARQGFPIVPLGRGVPLETLRQHVDLARSIGVVLAIQAEADLDEWPDESLGRTPIGVIGPGTPRSGYVMLPDQPSAAASQFASHLATAGNAARRPG